MYQVIARKYRPQLFAEVVNQEHVKTTLENAIAQNRIAHGYIFSGQRGTGKTTLARILARCLNCIQGPTTQPCGKCASCVEVAAGGAVDVIEIDAASNRGINEMRELRENVRYQPARERYKVFIIDEAHQITSEAFNALLKTIEEPPEWVVFILCTTEAHKIPATIASRCQHFSFRSVEFEALVTRMEWICRQEGIEADAEALSVLAQTGEGSVRDSLSALDQAIACCGAKLKAGEVRALLGAYSLESLQKVTEALTAASSAQMLAIVDELERSGRNLQHFSRELARYFRNLLVAKVADTRLIAASPEERQRLAAIARGFSEEDLTRYLQLSLDLFRDLQFSLQPRFHLELGLIRLVQAGRLVAIEEAIAALPGAEAPQKSEVRGGSPDIRPLRQPTPTAPPAPPRRGPAGPQMSSAATALAAAPAPPASDAEWKEALHAKLVEIGLPFTADGIEHASITASAAELQITAPKEFLLSLKPDDVNKAVQLIVGRALRIKISAGAGAAPAPREPAAANVEHDLSQRALANPEVKRFQELFGGQIRNIRSLKE